MGIRCYCPNGHKLNIKSFQAGLMGVCPQCGSRFQVPMQSVRKSSKREKAEYAIQVTEADNEVQPGQRTSSEPPIIGTPDLDAVVPQPVEPAQPASSNTPTTDPAPRTDSSAWDPLAEAPGASWYVRPAAGGQFGPATVEMMRHWLEEGRLGPESLVWRDGWGNWLEASTVFSRWGISGPQIEVHLSKPPSPLPEEVLKERLKPRRRSTRFNATVIAVLAAVVVILAIVLIEIVIRSSS